MPDGTAHATLAKKSLKTKNPKQKKSLKTLQQLRSNSSIALTHFHTVHGNCISRQCYTAFLGGVSYMSLTLVSALLHSHTVTSVKTHPCCKVQLIRVYLAAALGSCSNRCSVHRQALCCACSGLLVILLACLEHGFHTLGIQLSEIMV